MSVRAHSDIMTKSILNGLGATTMPGAASGKFAVKSCGKVHAWCATCRPAQAAAQRKPPRPKKEHTKPCRDCGRCDACLGIAAPDGMKLCRSCGETKDLSLFYRRLETGTYRNHCNTCRNKGITRVKCDDCGRYFTRKSPTRTLCSTCQPKPQKPCIRCGNLFVGTIVQRSYCSTDCREAALKDQRAQAYRNLRMEALRAYGGEHPTCICCGEDNPGFLALDHINGGGGQQRRELGGGGYWTWLRKNGYPEGFRVMCHNCNSGRQYNGGRCPHETE